MIVFTVTMLGVLLAVVGAVGGIKAMLESTQNHNNPSRPAGWKLHK